MNYWIFNTDETEDIGKGKHELMLSKQVIAAHGWCKGKGALRTLNKPDAGDVIYYYRAGCGFIASAVATTQNAVQTNEIFNARREYMRPVTDVKILKEGQVVTAAEVKSATGRTTSYRHIVSQIRHQEVVAYLSKRFKKIKPRSSKRNARTGSGGGFQPDPEKRVRVERAAVKLVTKIYKGEGWKVESVEQEKVGYDLYCTRGSRVACVEVKGTSSSREEFILTANEYESAKANEDFVICIVTNAVTKPILKKYSGKQLLAKFEMRPLSYRVKKND